MDNLLSSRSTNLSLKPIQTSCARKSSSHVRVSVLFTPFPILTRAATPPLILTSSLTTSLLRFQPRRCVAVRVPPRGTKCTQTAVNAATFA
mmetsp:Transcript_2321/g.5058  ORF Transcript_2321/g.5058 Transcript_2321/m.5058 type:complete len:91 (+) Transcript_2321:95-367(+)